VQLLRDRGPSGAYHPHTQRRVDFERGDAVYRVQGFQRDYQRRGGTDGEYVRLRVQQKT